MAHESALTPDDRIRNSWSRLIDELPDLCAVLDRDAVITYVSPSVERLLGVATNTVLGRCVCDLVDPQDGRNATAWFMSALQGDDVPEYLHRLRRGDGTVAWFESRARAVRSPDGRAQVLTVSRDVSVRTRFDQQLIATSRMWSDVCDVVQQGVLVHDASGTVIASNATAADLLGLDRQALAGTAVGAHLLLDDGGDGSVGLELEDLRRRPAGGVPVLVVRPDGSRRRALAQASELQPATTGPPLGLSVLLLTPGGSDPVSPRSAAGRIGDGVLTTPPLSRRETEVLTLLIDGLDVQAISARLDISVHTTRSYVKSVLRKLDVRTQLQAVVTALRAGLIDLS